MAHEHDDSQSCSCFDDSAGGCRHERISIDQENPLPDAVSLETFQRYQQYNALCTDCGAELLVIRGLKGPGGEYSEDSIDPSVAKRTD